MSTTSQLLLIATIFVISLQFANHWFLSKGKLHITYPMSIVILCTYMVIETTIALRDPEQYSMLLYNIINTWGVLMAIKGILRLRQEKLDKERNKNESK